MRFTSRYYPALAAAMALAALPARADMFNHKTILVGDKGAAFGGAFTGLADDATATFYNPAGMTQLKNVKLNVSAQIVQFQKQEIQISPDTFIPYNSFNFSPSITSFSQRMGDWAYGFSIVTPVNDLFRGEAKIEGAYRDPVSGNDCYDTDGNTPCYSRFNLSYYDVSKINLAGPSLALKFTDNISIGFTLYGIYYTELEKTAYGGWDGNFVGGNKSDLSRFHESSVTRSVSQTGVGVTGSFGMLVRVAPSLSFGVNASPGSQVWVDRTEEQRFQDLRNDSLVGPNPGDTSLTRARQLYNLDATENHEELAAPWLSAGFSWQPDSWLMVLGQVDYILGSLYSYTDFAPGNNSAARSGFEAVSAVEKHYTVEKKPVIDFSAGMNMRLTKVYSLALGAFTDMSQGPYENRPSSLNRRIDYYGGAISIGMDKEYTESRFGVNAAWGDAAITHLQWREAEGGHPEIATDSDGNVLHVRRNFDAFNVGIFLSSTLKI
jgi:long-subunit fatty acid transport protein